MADSIRMRMIRRGFLVSTVAASIAAAQATPPGARAPHDAQPERPTVATHAGTVSAGWIEFEAGAEFDHGTSPARATIGTLVTKIGIASHAQLSLFANAISPSNAAGGFGDFTIGVKWRVLDDHPLLGSFAILPSIKIPTGSAAKGSGTGTTDASLLFISSRDIGPIHIDLNAGWTRRDGSGVNAPVNASVWTASFAGAISGPLQWTAEVFGFPGTGGAQGAAPIVALLAGPTFGVTKWLVVDAGAIVPIAGAQPHALYAGVTWNAGKLWGAQH